MNRRGFLGAMLAACAAPAVVKASNIMRIAPDRGLFLPVPLASFPYPNLSIDDFQARVMGPINRAMAAHVDDALCDEIAADLLRTGQVGMVDRFSFIVSPSQYPNGMVDGRIQLVSKESLMDTVGAHAPPGFYGKGVPELMAKRQRIFNEQWVENLKDYTDPVGEGRDRVLIRRPPFA